MIRQLLLGAALGLLLVACAEGEAQPSATKPKPETARSSLTAVRAVTVANGVLNAKRSVTVTLEAATDSEVASSVGGRVTGILQREGARVEAGQVVVRFDDRDATLALRTARIALETARVNLTKAWRSSDESRPQAQARLKAAQTNLEVVRTRFVSSAAQYEAGGLAPVEFQSAKAQLEQARAEVQNASDAVAREGRAGGEDLALLKLQVAQAENNLRQAEKNLAEAGLKAPFSGEVVEMPVEVGEFVAAGAKVFRLANTSSLRATFSVPPNEARLLGVGSGVTVRYAGKTYAAKITRNALVPGSTRLVGLTAKLLAAGSLPAGSVAQLEYALRLAQGSLVPSGALQTAAGRNFVFAVRDGKVASLTVQVLGEAGGRVAVTGLAPGGRVVYPVPPSLEAGASVEVVGGEVK